MQHNRIKLAVAALAALLIAPGATQAQFSFGHFGDFSSAQGAPAQWSTTAPGMYASGQYLTAGPWNYPLGNMNQPGPYPLVHIRQVFGENIYVPPTPSNPYEQPRNNTYMSVPVGGNGGGTVQSNPYQPESWQAYAPPPAVNPPAPAPRRWTKDFARYNYNRGFESGYNTGMSRIIPVRIIQTAPPNPFSSN